MTTEEPTTRRLSDQELIDQIMGSTPGLLPVGGLWLASSYDDLEDVHRVIDLVHRERFEDLKAWYAGPRTPYVLIAVELPQDCGAQVAVTDGEDRERILPRDEVDTALVVVRRRLRQRCTIAAATLWAGAGQTVTLRHGDPEWPLLQFFGIALHEDRHEVPWLPRVRPRRRRRAGMVDLLDRDDLAATRGWRKAFGPAAALTVAGLLRELCASPASSTELAARVKHRYAANVVVPDEVDARVWLGHLADELESRR
jgi:hypothetical protein